MLAEHQYLTEWLLFLVPEYKLLKLFLKDYLMVVGTKKLTQEVPYLGGNTELVFYVEGLRFPDKDFDGLITINLSLLEPSGKVSERDHRLILNATCRTSNVLFLVLFCLSAYRNKKSYTVGYLITSKY